MFARTYFPDYFSSEWCQFHHDVVNELQDIILNRREVENKVATAAPRGHAKSTIFTFLGVVWCCCYGYKKNIVVISATGTIAKQFIIDCRTELEFNEKIKKDFGNLRDDLVWTNTAFYTKTGVYVAGKGAGEQMRGMKWKGARPDLVLIDDLEEPEVVASPTQREQLERWFIADVLPMGSPHCDYLMIGTVLSYDALLFKLLTEPRFSDWQRKSYKAVIKFSQSELWTEWERIMTDLSRKEPAKDAKAFYLEHKEEMLEGTEVLWESQRPDMYLFLMSKRLVDEDSFNSEYQNDPQTESSRIFKEAWWHDNVYTVLPEIKRVYGAVDPSCGKTRKADTSAIIILGEGADNYIYVLEADLKVRKPEQIILDMQKFIAKYYNKLQGFVVETNQMQSFFSTTVKEECLKMGMMVNWIEVSHYANDKKDMRIKSMIPKIKNGYIKFNDNHLVLKKQLRNYPKDRDDGVDCLEMALRPLLEAGGHRLSFGSIVTAASKFVGRKEDKGVREIKKVFGF